MNERPKVGSNFKHPHTGILCKIVKVRDFGTIDIETPDGKSFRVTGLPFI